jgi:hypothetical protein
MATARVMGEDGGTEGRGGGLALPIYHEEPNTRSSMRADRSAVVTDIKGRVRLAFTRRQAPVSVPVPAVNAGPNVDVVAFAEDCVLSGRLHLTTERLSDLLNENVEFELVDVLVDGLAGGDALDVRDIVVHRDELLLIQASEPRGNAGRRRRTMQHPIIAKLGPYEVWGYVHTLPGGVAIESLTRGRPLVALTDAVVEYLVGDTLYRREMGVLLLNRERIDWIKDGQGEDVQPIGVPADRPGLLPEDAPTD